MIRLVVQFIAAVVVMLVGAWLIGWWAVGIVLFLLGVLIAADALLRDDQRPRANTPNESILERYRRAR